MKTIVTCAYIGCVMYSINTYVVTVVKVRYESCLWSKIELLDNIHVV